MNKVLEVMRAKSGRALVAIGFLLFSIPCLAQNYPRAEIFGGYMLNRLGDGIPFVGHGFDVSVTGNLHRNFGITGDLGVQFKSGVKMIQYLAGPRLAVRGQHVTGFVHALFGGTTFTNGGSDHGFAMALGGGLQVNASPRGAVRLFQVDYHPIRIAGDWGTQNFRVAAGIVFNIGGS